jgi:hypothetical protein
MIIDASIYQILNRIEHEGKNVAEKEQHWNGNKEIVPAAFPNVMEATHSNS